MGEFSAIQSFTRGPPVPRFLNHGRAARATFDMEPLPMPSDVKGAGAAGASAPAGESAVAEGATTKKELPPVAEPPSARLIVRLFLIPLLIAAGVVTVMLLFGALSGGYKSVYEAVDELERTGGGERTADVLVGPGSKQRYIAAQYISFEMRRMAE